MKTHILTTLTILALSSAVFAQDSHDKPIPGPKGGKVVEVAGGHAEFFVQNDKKVSVTFYDEGMKPIAPGVQVVSIIAEAPEGRAKLEFAKADDAFLSTTPLPEGEGYRIVLQIKPNADTKPSNTRIDYHHEACAECNRPEYACVCETKDSAHDGHGH